MTLSPHYLIAGICLALGMVAGFVMHRSDFCLAGVFRDLFLFGSSFKLRQLVLLIACTMLLFEAARLAGLLPLYPFPLLGPATAAGLMGAFLFGIGMVLSGGCVVGTLYKMGAGSLLSFVAFLGLIAGSGLYAEFHPSWKSLLTATTLFGGKITIPQILGIPPFLLVVPVSIILTVLLVIWWRRGGMSRALNAQGAMQPWHAAVILALVSLASFTLVGMPLGITTAYAKMAALIESAVAPGHLASVAFYATRPMNYQHPLTAITLAGGPGAALDGIALVQFPVILGVVLGGTISALSIGEFSPYARVPLRQYLSAAAGGVIMGVASRMAPACNVWHLLGGLPILAAASVMFVIGLLPGAWVGSRILAGWVIK